MELVAIFDRLKNKIEKLRNIIDDELDLTIDEVKLLVENYPIHTESDYIDMIYFCFKYGYISGLIDGLTRKEK